MNTKENKSKSMMHAVVGLTAKKLTLSHALLKASGSQLVENSIKYKKVKISYTLVGRVWVTLKT